MTTLYANHYKDDTHVYFSIYQGIYTTRYSFVKSLGCINTTQRIYYKLAKHPQKVIEQNGPHIRLNGYQRQYTEIAVLFEELEYPIELLNEVTQIVQSKAWDPTVKVGSSLEF
jgi:hypothetical protein